MVAPPDDDDAMFSLKAASPPNTTLLPKETSIAPAPGAFVYDQIWEVNPLPPHDSYLFENGLY